MDTLQSPHFTPRRRLISAAVASMALALVMFSAGCAQVSVLPGEVPPDSNQTMIVRVQNAVADPTVKVRVEFPAGLAVQQFQPKAGWKRDVERDPQKRITAVTWSGGQIGEGEFEDFLFTAHTPKESGTIAFKTYQTYQNGTTIEWVNAKGQERPAAFVEVKSGGLGGAAAASAQQQAGGVNVGRAEGAPAPDNGGDARAIIGLALLAALSAGVLALLAVALSIVALVCRPRVA